jgi:hypothetical protein
VRLRSAHDSCGAWWRQRQAIQLQIDVSAALVRMRAHAYGTDQSVAFVAQEIVAHRPRLSDDGPIENKE